MNFFSEEDMAAVGAISNIMQQGAQKRSLDDNADAAGGMRPSKMARPDPAGAAAAAAAAARPTRPAPVIRELKPAPYFYYRDHSQDADPDPLTPLTPPGRVPNFPAKMQAILSKKEYSDIVAWLPHGRSWRILKPREFEVKVIPKFFEHSKFSSFIRQANGWGFRRITQGRDRNSYYHPLFLRGLPHLCKSMKRPGINEKKQADPDHEPDLYAISEENPIPEKNHDDSVLLHCTLQGGPKARMPIYWGSTAAATSVQPVVHTTAAPKDQLALQSFQQSMNSFDQQVIHMKPPSPMNVSPPVVAKPIVATIPSFLAMPTTGAPPTAPVPATVPAAAPQANPFAALAAANHMAFPMPPQMQMAMNPAMPQMQMAVNPAMASQFAAGFAAATAMTQQHFNTMFSNMAAQQQGFQQQAAQQQTQGQQQ
ncbi:shock factor protein [Seminavis robusta]|uniref:Shock factor protein n=1 Tax=Seminavis robusta TaxID=568900 RepID=A0A9N8E6M3_9STRA|nr:shock factor protein [Seminavis robusta]|eukprot:Sro599_g173330.1 shock factor protein (424) ;mRNA; r:55502-56868